MGVRQSLDLHIDTELVCRHCRMAAEEHLRTAPATAGRAPRIRKARKLYNRDTSKYRDRMPLCFPHWREQVERDST